MYSVALLLLVLLLVLLLLMLHHRARIKTFLTQCHVARRDGFRGKRDNFSGRSGNILRMSRA